MIRFEIGGRQVDPGNLSDALMAAMLESIKAQIEEKVGTIRDPETGEFPTVVVRGNDLDNLKLHVDGSPAIIALVRERLGISQDEAEGTEEALSMPRVFLSYTFDDSDLARSLAERLQASGIDTWWAEWCIRPGDSLRQRIDEGLSGCTHFLVLLTPRSIEKPWVNQEMDAGLVAKLSNQCRFLAIRHELPASELPPLLKGMLSPEIKADEDITQLINDIHGVSRKPPLGPAPMVVAQSADTKNAYSPAANMIAKLFVERTKHGVFADPQTSVAEIADETGLTESDTKDGLFELSHFFRDYLRRVLVEPSLFTEFDRHWMPWDPAIDAVKLAADINNDPDFPSNCQQIADLYGWEPRRLNPAITYLQDRKMLMDYRMLDVPQFVTVRVVGKSDEIRRFLKSRQ